MKRPSFQFYPADWRKDPALSSCSLAARGLWIELICIAHESDRYGTLSVNGKAMTPAQLSRMVGESPKTFDRLLQELEGAAVFSRDECGVIFSRRMLKDEHIRNVRAESGKQGGNPNLLKQKSKQKTEDKDKQTDKQILTPSSSSSSSKENPISADDFLISGGQGQDPKAPGRDIPGDTAFWKPSLGQLNPRLVMAGIPIPEPPELIPILMGFRDYYTGQFLTDGQCYQKLVTWIQRSRNEQAKSNHRTDRRSGFEAGDAAGEQWLAEEREAARHAGAGVN